MQHKLPVREKVVASAKRLFSERGFHRTAMADLALDAQVSVGAIYRSFASKADIIRDIIRADTDGTLDELRANISAVRNGTTKGQDTIAQMILEWASPQQDDALYHEIIAEAHRSPEVAQMVTSTCGEFRELLRELATLLKPGLTEAEIEGVAELLLACLFGMGNREFTAPRLSPDQTAAVVTQLLLQGVKA
ncbi:TetR/AcrR family transcriptional regulator [Novosphingobium sp. JCM 18896]|uniref:TetR/AcrR family transcriptional regulator n=1 Tax=Novosphingobium sp. JCM 18896 TaxID=2989731 RepID=UPI0022212CE5|nr:TetR/AcrR family transcriptional regulator [Novosphingobium sp. JCM 18896]